LLKLTQHPLCELCFVYQGFSDFSEILYIYFQSGLWAELLSDVTGKMPAGILFGSFR
jgi:hypothetical protein